MDRESYLISNWGAGEIPAEPLHPELEANMPPFLRSYEDALRLTDDGGGMIERGKGSKMDLSIRAAKAEANP